MTVVIRDIASGQERDIQVAMNQFRYARSFRWFPDDRSLLFVENNAQRRVFKRVDAVTGAATVLVDTPHSNVHSTSVTSDGRHLIYTLSDPSDLSLKQVRRRDLTTGEDRKLLEARGSNGPPAFHGFDLSPDGRSMAFFKSFDAGSGSVNWSLWVAALPDGEPREIWKPRDMFVFPSQARWNVDGKGVFVVTAKQGIFDTPQAIWYVPVNGSPAHNLGVAMPTITLTGVHPAGDRLGFTGGAEMLEIWTLKNLFRATPTSR